MRRACLQQFSPNLNRFRNEFAQRIASQGTSIKGDQQELLMPVSRDENRRNPSAQAARCAVTVNLPLAGIHHAQVTLAVYDFAGDPHTSQVARRLLNCGRGIDHSDGAGCYLYHCSALAINQLALQTDSFAIEAGHEVVGPMFSGRDQEIARVFVLLPDLPRTRDQQRWERASHDYSLKTAQLPVFK